MLKIVKLDKTHPELAKQWHPTKNGDLLPKDVTHGSGKKVWWLCSKEHYFEAIIANRARGSNCPYCANQKVGFGNDLETNFPEVAKLWHPTKNDDLRPSQVLPGAHKKAWWLCKNEHEYEALIYGRMQGKGCVYCDGKKVGYGNDLETNYPEIAKLWHPRKNGDLKPNMVTSGSNRKVWWICEKGHDHKTSPKSKRRAGECPYCLNQKVGYGNDLLTKYPRIAEQWHKKRNGIKKPSDYVYASNTKVWWECDYGHEWKTGIRLRHLGTGCPKCSNQTSKIEVYIFSELKSVFNSIKHRERVEGYEIDIYIVELNLGIEYDGYFWHKNKLKKDKHKFKNLKSDIKIIRLREYPLKQISSDDLVIKWADDYQKTVDSFFNHLLALNILNKNQNRKIKSYLKGTKPKNIEFYEQQIAGLPGPIYVDSLEYKYPELIKEWHPKNKLQPSKYGPGSRTKVWWICNKGHEYECRIGSRTRTGTKRQGCPYCTGRKLGYGNDFESLFSDLAKEWHPTKNGDLLPSKVHFGSKNEYWWICKKGHEYEQVIGERTGKKQLACPYCSGKKVGYGNDFESLFPDLAKEWHPTKNGDLKPSQIRHGSKKNIWWICDKGHEYDRPLTNRTSTNYGCPFCSKHQFRLGYGNDLQSKYPEIAKLWHPTKNNKLKPNQVIASSRKKAWFQCAKGHEYEQAIYYSCKSDGCPYCRHRKIGYGNDLKTLYPILMKEWDNEKNIDLGPCTIGPGSHEKAWWICNKGHSYQAHIRNRAKLKSGCTYCSGQKAGYGNDFESLFPQLAKEWHPTKNDEVRPDQIKPRTHTKRWWKCKNGHEWKQSVLSRVTTKNNQCKVCSSK